MAIENTVKSLGNPVVLVKPVKDIDYRVPADWVLR